MKRIALKIDVDTCRGTLAGVPALIEQFQRNNAGGTFFFSVGPDQSGRETGGTSLRKHYDLPTRLYGRVLPSPDIGVRCAEIMLQARSAGFEVGIRAWNRVRWEQASLSAGNEWIEAEMGKACARFAQIFVEKPHAHGAAGWRMNRHALRLTQRLGFVYASDCRGHSPFMPVIDGEIIACPQLPTTLPTLDELLALEPLSPDQAADRILQLSRAIGGDHVFTLRAELEGMKFAGAIGRLLEGWKDHGYELIPLCEMASALDTRHLPHHTVHLAETPGRPGQRITQGPAFLER